VLRSQLKNHEYSSEDLLWKRIGWRLQYDLTLHTLLLVTVPKTWCASCVIQSCFNLKRMLYPQEFVYVNFRWLARSQCTSERSCDRLTRSRFSWFFSFLKEIWGLNPDPTLSPACFLYSSPYSTTLKRKALMCYYAFLCILLKYFLECV
jgi:hypothetical protein